MVKTVEVPRNYGINEADDTSREPLDRRALLFKAAGVLGLVVGASYTGINYFTSGEKPKGSQGNGGNLISGDDPTAEATEPVFEGVVDQGDIAMTAPKLDRMPDLYGLDETSPEAYFEAYDESDPAQKNLRRMFHITDKLLKGRGEHSEYPDAVIELLSDAAKPGCTEEELMEFMRPEFFASKVGMTIDQISELEAETELAIENYINAMVDKYTDVIYEAIGMPDGDIDKHLVGGYAMLVQLRKTALRKFAEHTLEYKNTNWKMSFSAGNPNEDVRGSTTFVDATVAANIKAWSTDGEMVTNATEFSEIFFGGKSERGGFIGTEFSAIGSEEYQSFMGALERLSQA